MEVLDEKANGAPHLEPEEAVSVKDREHVPLGCASTASLMFTFLVRKRKHLRLSICQTLGRKSRTSRSLAGSLRVGRSWRRKLRVPSLSVAVTDGEYTWWSMHIPSRLRLACCEAYPSLPLWQLKCTTKRYGIRLSRLCRPQTCPRGMARVCAVRARDL